MNLTCDNRLQATRTLMKQENIDGYLISLVPNMYYLTSFSGFSSTEREGFLFVTQKSAYIITDGRLSAGVKKTLPFLLLRERTPTHSLLFLLKEIVTQEHLTSLGIEETNITAYEYKQLLALNTPLKNFSLNSLRMIKTSDEIKKIAQACLLTDNAFSFILPLLKKGVTEQQIQSYIDIYMKQHGGESAFPPIVAFGDHSATPHHTATNRSLRSKDQILLDFGAKINHYCSDMTRTVFKNTPTPEQVDLYETVKASQHAAYTYLAQEKHAGAKQADHISQEYITSHNYPPYPHALGHGVGLEVHEHPLLSSTSAESLTTGMVFTLEPGIYVRGEGGVRIEDVVFKTDKGITYLTHSPREIIVL